MQYFNFVAVFTKKIEKHDFQKNCITPNFIRCLCGFWRRFLSPAGDRQAQKKPALNCAGRLVVEDLFLLLKIFFIYFYI